MACDACTAVLQRRERLWKRLIQNAEEETVIMLECLHHTSARELEDAANSGCPMCVALWETFTPPQKHALLSADKSRPKVATPIPSPDDQSHDANLARSQLRHEWLTHASLTFSISEQPAGSTRLIFTTHTNALSPRELQFQLEQYAVFRLDPETLEGKIHFKSPASGTR